MGRPPYTVIWRLYAYAREYWQEINGETAYQGVNLLILPLDRFCDAIYWWCVQRVEDRAKFDYELTKPAPGDTSELAIQAEQDSFAAFMAMGSMSDGVARTALADG